MFLLHLTLNSVLVSVEIVIKYTNVFGCYICPNQWVRMLLVFGIQKKVPQDQINMKMSS